MNVDPEPDIFLSSAFRNFMDVREKIRNINPKRVWTVEEDRKDLGPKARSLAILHRRRTDGASQAVETRHLRPARRVRHKPVRRN
jgi:hypothetical protein